MKRIKYKKYAGVRIKGEIPIPKPSGLFHIENAEWLTAQVESGGVFGTVQNYDGTGMTAGLHQMIGVYPRTKQQGPLWSLLEVLNRAFLCENVDAPLFDALTHAGYWIDGGVLCHAGANVAVSVSDIRKEFTGNESGVMPLRGPLRARAEQWARLFSDAFSNPITFAEQSARGLPWIVVTSQKVLNSGASTRLGVYNSLFLNNTRRAIGEEKDLAMSVYYSHAVNAPAAALQRLRKAADEYDPIDKPRDFAKVLIRRLGKARYGRWHFSDYNGRYQRTRRAARQLWPRELFESKGAIMPYKF